MKFRSFLLATMLCALCVTQASALEYTFDAPEDYLFGQPTRSAPTGAIPGITHKRSVRLPPTQATPTASGIISPCSPAQRMPPNTPWTTGSTPPVISIP